MKKGKVIIFSAPSGSGKTTIVHSVLKKFPELEFSVSATTRTPRKNEKHGKDYFFLTEEEFKNKISQSLFLEWEEVYEGRFYGTLKSEVDRILATGKSVVFDVDVKGGISIKRHYGENAISFFIRPPSLDVLRIRLQKRGTDSEEEIERRLEKVGRELEDAWHFDQVVVNDILQEAIEEVESIMIPFLNSAE